LGREERLFWSKEFKTLSNRKSGDECAQNSFQYAVVKNFGNPSFLPVRRKTLSLLVESTVRVWTLLSREVLWYFIDESSYMALPSAGFEDITGE
jgi:hypothetical protein